MADVIDKILTKTLSGGLDLEIKQRESDLRTVRKNYGVNKIIQSKNSFSNPVENTLSKLDADKYLDMLIKLRDCVYSCMNKYDDEHKSVFYARYRNKLKWTAIEYSFHINERTGGRWKNDLKDNIRIKIDDTFGKEFLRDYEKY